MLTEENSPFSLRIAGDFRKQSSRSGSILSCDRWFPKTSLNPDSSADLGGSLVVVYSTKILEFHRDHSQFIAKQSFEVFQLEIIALGSIVFAIEIFLYLF